ncbi:hypothetical protein TBLA_0A07440 [Henningerozyma blattae CBS 6284]|uniref:RNA polymerase II-associated protein RBA50 n=1 Tax=Henningerozyma blattae (strain ATCC 34711 / CBS 6284 / DSM 70876 / NBRC 10599 / NRRL Y-10934 / UCD 77-7) TaxID=1071380 RepID=I2GWN2_HENB6|nr:hypothetical protein TBLA_0A07440 [Tetrapisispora blattae CBS 6284]CCH58534.1 hypothetical protein TBLA_0A07440 [Tetrapisispora blattae CBS 6284]
MDLLGDIVEKDNDDSEFNIIEKDPDSKLNQLYAKTKNGFPELYKPEKISSWKQRLNEKRRAENIRKQRYLPDQTVPVDIAKSTFRDKAKEVSEAKLIHQENINTIKNMSTDEILKEREELLNSLDPKLIQNLLKNIIKRSKTKTDQAPLFAEIDGASGTWIGGTSDLNELTPMTDKEINEALGVIKVDEIEDRICTNKKSVSFAELESDKENSTYEYEPLDDDDIAPLDFQIAQSIDHMDNDKLMEDVHFMKFHKNDNDEEIAAKIYKNLSINDPEFNQKLHEKFFPELPKEINKLKWMEPVPEKTFENTAINDMSQLRFDFKGDLVPPTREINDTTHSALHHHENDSHLAGYTIPELTRLSRSTFPQQRSIAIQTLGRILYKMGKQLYYQLTPEIDAETYKELGGTTVSVTNHYYEMLWDLIKDCKVIESIEDGSDENKTKHLSVRNYSIDALWLWKQGGGDFRKSKILDTK